MARCTGKRHAEDLHRLASRRFSSFLLLEIRARSATDTRGTARTHPNNGARQSVLGEERIANALLLKLGIRVSPPTVRKYLPKRPPGQPRGDQRWSTFLQNHATAVLACDFCVIVTATFRLLYVLVVIEHQTRRIVHSNVTAHPTAAWALQ
jgi:hypothetical protein